MGCWGSRFRAERPDAAPAPTAPRGSHLSRPVVADRLVRPTRRHRTSSPRSPPYSALHRVGLAWPSCHHDAGALLPHHFTFAATATAWRADGVLCNFCGAFPRVSPAGRYPAPRSTVSGLSSTPAEGGSRGYPSCTVKYTAAGLPSGEWPRAVTHLPRAPHTRRAPQASTRKSRTGFGAQMERGCLRRPPYPFILSSGIGNGLAK